MEIHQMTAKQIISSLEKHQRRVFLTLLCIFLLVCSFLINHSVIEIIEIFDTDYNGADHNVVKFLKFLQVFIQTPVNIYRIF